MTSTVLNDFPSTCCCPKYSNFQGPIVRISPTEIHVRDHDFFNELMASSSRPRDKTEFLIGLPGQVSIFGTALHEIHRLRRSAVESFFSKKSVTEFEPLVQEKVDDLCAALQRYADTQEVLDFGEAFHALALDVISHHAFGKAYGLVKQYGFAPSWKHMMYETMESFSIARHLPWLPAIFKILPPRIRSFVNKNLAFCLELQAVRKRHLLSIFE